MNKRKLNIIQCVLNEKAGHAAESIDTMACIVRSITEDLPSAVDLAEVPLDNEQTVLCQCTDEPISVDLSTFVEDLRLRIKVTMHVGDRSESVNYLFKGRYGRYSFQFEDDDNVYSVYILPDDFEALFGHAFHINDDGTVTIIHPEYLSFDKWEIIAGLMHKLGYEIYDADDAAKLFSRRVPLNIDQSDAILKRFFPDKIREHERYPEQTMAKFQKELKKMFGITSSPRLAGYISLDGSLINFSYEGYQRDRDHREVNELFLELDDFDDVSGTEALVECMRLGNIRVNINGVEFIHKPTEAQMEAIIKMMRYVHRQTFNGIPEDFAIDAANDNGALCDTKIFRIGTYGADVRDAIEQYFETGYFPE